jgi:ketopantoate reductase
VILGTMVKKAKELKVAVPTLEVLYAMTLAVDQRLERSRKEASEAEKTSNERLQN